MNELDYLIWYLAPATLLPNDFSSSPEGLNYKTGLHIRLQKKPTIVSGQLMMMEYYELFNRNTGEYKNKILEVAFQWIRDEQSKQLVERLGKIRWALASDSSEVVFGKHVKYTTKPYDARTSSLADARRRRNIIDEALALIDFMAANVNPDLKGYVQTMLRSLDDELNTYINTNDRKLVEKIGTYSGVWLDVGVYEILNAIGKQDIFEGITLRQALMGTLNYAD